MGAVIAVIAVIFVASGRIGGYPGKDFVARLTVEGVIQDDRGRDELLEEALKNDNIRALIVRIDSPGGTTAGGESLYQAIRKVGEKKPVISVIGTLGASAGYMIALGGDRVIARGSSITGSIGVLFQNIVVADMLQRWGVQSETVKSGPLKASPSPFEQMTEESRKAMQAMIDDTYHWFVDIVAERRGLDPAVATRLADGRVYTGRQALEHGLIDSLGGEDEAREWLAREHDIAVELPTIELDSRPPGEILAEQLFGSLTFGFQKFLGSERLGLDGLISVWQPEG